MHELQMVALLASLAVCCPADAGDMNPSTPAAEAASPSAPPCNADVPVAKFELKVAQDGKTEADVVASPSLCGPGARVGIHHIPPVSVDSRQLDSSNALDVELSIERAGRPGLFLVSLETKRLDATRPTQTGPGIPVANVITRSWSGVVSLKPGEEMTVLKDGGQVATMRRAQ